MAAAPSMEGQVAAEVAKQMASLQATLSESVSQAVKDALRVHAVAANADRCAFPLPHHFRDDILRAFACCSVGAPGSSVPA